MALAVTATHAQDGALHTTYNPNQPLTYVHSSTLDNNNNLFIGGTNPDTNIVGDVIKITSTGSIDPNFNVTYFNNYSTTQVQINAICLQGSNVLIGGRLDNSSDIGNNLSILKFNSAGVHDVNFTDNLPQGFVIKDIAIQPVTNKILVAGYTEGGYTGNCLYRLNNDGSIDSSFNTNGSGVFGSVHHIFTLNNGDMYIGGSFNSYNGQARKSLAKINANGSLNSLVFDPAMIADVNNIAVDSNGRVIAVGSFLLFADNYSSRIVRFNTNGTRDTTFNPPPTPAPTHPYSLLNAKSMSGNKILIGGMFYTVDGVSRNGIARLNEDGSLDNCFNPGAGVSGSVTNIELSSNETIYIAGIFTKYNNVTRSSVARIQGSTSIIANNDTGLTFAAGGIAVANVLSNDLLNSSVPSLGNVTLTQLSTTHSGVNLNTSNRQVIVSPGVPLGMYTVTYKICVIGTGTCFCDTADITVYVANTIDAVNDEVLISSTSGNQVAGSILNNDLYAGSAATTANVTVTIVSALPTGLTHDGAGNFNANNVAPGNYIITYNICDNTVPGNCDTATFTLIVTTPNSGLGANDTRANNTVKVSGVQTTNGIIIAGDFSNYGGVTVNKIARLKPEDLTLDPSFTTTGPIDGSYQPLITDFKILPTNEIIVVGRWGSSINGGFNGRSIAKLTPFGNVTAGWNAGGQGATQGSVINAVAIVPFDQSIVVVGTFTSFNGPTRLHMARLQPNGNVINSFNSYVPGQTGFTGGEALCVAIQNNSYAIIGGSFTHFNGTPVGGIVRVNLNTGAIEPTFDTTGVPAGSRIEEILVNGNEIYVGGNFSSYDGSQRRNIAKLDANGNLIGTFTGGFNNTVRSIVLQRTPQSYVNQVGPENLYVGGDFTAHNYAGNTTSVSHIACIHPVSGGINTSLNIGGASSNIHTLTLENSGVKLIVGGEFTQYNAIQAERITRIFPGYTGNDLIQGQGRFNTLEAKNPVGRNITIYPNPSTGIFTIDFEGYEQETFNVVINNPLGQEVYRNIIKAESSKYIDLASFEKGNYFITLQTGNETINKIIIIK